MAKNLKIPFLPKKDLLGQKKQLIKGVPNNVIYIVGGATLAAGGLYYAADAGLLDAILPGLGLGGNAATVVVQAYPGNVKTGEMVQIEGDFRDGAGQPATVPTGYLAIYEDTGAKLYETTLGKMVSHFKQSVSTANWRDGSFTAVVSDQPPVAPLGHTAGTLSTYAPPSNNPYSPAGGASITVS